LLIGANTPILSPLLPTNVIKSKPNIVTTELTPHAVIEAANKHLPATIALLIMNPYEAEGLMRFTTTVSYNGWPSKKTL